MRNHLATTLAILTSVGGTSIASADAPAWCAPIGDHRVDFAGLDHALRSEDPRDALHDLVGALCRPDAEARQHAAELEARRGIWSKRFGLSDADWADVATWAIRRQDEQKADNFEVADPNDGGIGSTLKRAWSSFGPLDQFALMIATAGTSGDPTLHKHYFADALGPRLTEAGRLAYLGRCARSADPVEWAMCAGDFAAYDPTKLSVELRADPGYSGYEKMIVRFAADRFASAAPAHAAAVTKLIASDAGYAKLFEVATAARATWQGIAQANAPTLALIAELEDARATNSRKGYAGCADKAWSAWSAAIAALPASSWAGIRARPSSGMYTVDGDVDPNYTSLSDDILGRILVDPTAYLASTAMAMCAADGGLPDAIVDDLAHGLRGRPGYLGPRSTVETTLMRTGIELDDRDAQLQYPSVGHRFRIRGDGEPARSATGVIAKVSTQGDKVRIEFVRNVFNQDQCQAQSPSRPYRVTRIESDGRLIYDTVCTQWKSVRVDATVPPYTVAARYAKGLHAGQLVSLTGDVVTAAWANTKATAPDIVHGIRVK